MGPLGALSGVLGFRVNAHAHIPHACAQALMSTHTSTPYPAPMHALPPALTFADKGIAGGKHLSSWKQQVLEEQLKQLQATGKPPGLQQDGLRPGDRSGAKAKAQLPFIGGTFPQVRC